MRRDDRDSSERIGVIAIIICCLISICTYLPFIYFLVKK
ncbi:hypothetical protein KNU94_gp67 [Xanthomonas phage FoX2]|uniref:Uncharacterized protein n=3 Tax=Foxunavirus TaxID=2948712 RepID=A0A858NPN5_9CAUD|nr:hypothetical protein KNU94_gp67 [Xanthomonas phage FoX2]YP_010106830.1 hypothetical protein KNU95_gp43 [Xanthomonas phage FoX3]YP_010106911.1 hypothetical protein KNU96_gp66 [Xanthomonas phage FoX5]QWY14283.1 hypothetical protein [Xanthomonas phage M29]QJB21865.1 hypothetical protein XccvBFoX2_gp46 [Xanthomonas phage FoX2]QJB21943.1 hypothetical protein XccvBFoX3_gp43 [Xanthomonas phage FoX3]QJB22024.1 hypothetical protein XccvBFoX5_gp46 [Xanthomonas phage FoX5]